MDWSIVGQKIKQQRKSKKITQHELANLIGKTESSIAKYEQGLVNIPVEILKLIAKNLEISVYDLISQATFEEAFPKEAQRARNFLDIKRGIIVILEEIYGTVEIKELVVQKRKYEYYLIGKGSDAFILYPNDIQTFEKATKAIIPPIVERIKDTRPESKIIQEFQSMIYPIPVSEDLIRKLKQESQPTENAPESTETALERKDTTPDETPTETAHNPPEKD